MFYEPQTTQFDLNFAIGKIPVRINPFFWLLVILLGRNLSPPMLLLWIIAATLSLLIHELGHALALKYFHISSRIILYGFGGLTVFDRRYHLRWFENAFISFAGPGAGFLFLGGIAFLFSLIGQHEIWNFFLAIPGLAPFPNLAVTQTVFMFLYFLFEINILWGILNLLPIYPLDGGQIVRETLVNFYPQDGLNRSLKISFVTAVIFVVWFFLNEQLFAALMFGWIAFSNYQILNQFTRRW
ncbi:MAG: hypothetical protein E7028_06740 [Planctomycetaceae bacterium]|nr:hypothetical protein [Planctomycetaceae bacterium]MBQ2822812.1 site-2 protease family protein [Thermoguttaceae bacterium]